MGRYVVGLVMVGACGSPAATPIDAAVHRDARLAIDAAAGLAVMPLAVDFGATIIGCRSAVQTLTVSNPGGSAAGPLATGLAGSGASSFAITSDGCAGMLLTAAATCAVMVQHAPVPGTTSSMTASLVISAPALPSVMVTLDGTMLTTVPLTISPSVVDFGAVASGTTSGSRTVTLTEALGCGASGVLAVQAPSGADPSQFAIVSDTCSGHALAGGATCTVDVSYAPTSSGTKSAVINVMAASGETVSVALTGT